MILLLWLTGVADLMLTGWALSFRLYCEANPIMAWAFEKSIPGAIIGGIVVTTLACWAFHWARGKVRWLNLALWGLLAMRAFVLWVHAGWIASWLSVT